ncbi:hypothetical protein MNBD_DELTA02-1013 [hydrothermal vent metagenome]|uniref:Homoserine dehydrogenase n=1 Tax=hydrothermal vent metagenome TaxID=652676 RepID=A0A3B0VA28_9ZZZZ
MARGKKRFKVVVLGLGRVGSTFLSKLSQIDDLGIDIVGAVEKDSAAAGYSMAKSADIPVYASPRDIVRLGEAIDIIFDLSGSVETRKLLRADLARAGNQHTVLVTEVMAHLIWNLMDEVGGLPDFHHDTGY